MEWAREPVDKSSTPSPSCLMIWTDYCCALTETSNVVCSLQLYGYWYEAETRKETHLQTHAHTQLQLRTKSVISPLNAHQWHKKAFLAWSHLRCIQFSVILTCASDEVKVTQTDRKVRKTSLYTMFAKRPTLMLLPRTALSEQTHSHQCTDSLINELRKEKTPPTISFSRRSMKIWLATWNTELETDADVPTHHHNDA